MRPILCRLSSLALGLPLACGAAQSDGDGGSNSDGFFGTEEGTTGVAQAAQSFLAFPGAGTSGAGQPLTASLGPDTSDDCDPQPSAPAAGAASSVQTVCFFSAEDPGVPAATIEQVVEVVGTAEWVHLRLTLNPDFVDNTYGETAIGWGAQGGPPPPPARGDGPPPPDGAGRPPREGGPGQGPAAAPPGGERPRAGARAGHTFRDLVGSDHAEIQLLDSNAQVAVHFRIDYVSASVAASSGYASLGVSGGEGKLMVGDPEWFLASATSIDRNLNACGLGSFVTDSPATDEAYTPNAAATDWDYRVAYEVWVSTEAFGDADFGSALIENVHASPSKASGDTTDVLPAPCPVDPADPEAVPQPLPVVLQTIR